MATRRIAPRFDEFAPALRQQLLAARTIDGPAIAAVWGRYLVDRNPADFALLCEHYTPIAWLETVKARRRVPLMFNGPIADYVSDGLLGMIQQIERVEQFTMFLTFARIRRSVRRAIWNETRARSWSGRRRAEQLATLALIRSDLTREHGRLPTREEMIGRLGHQVTNPNIYFAAMDDAGREMLSPSQRPGRDREDGESAMHRQADPESSRPIDNVINEEVIRLALKRLDATDKKIFRLMLAGHGPSEIARRVKLNLANVRSRLNGVLWTARCRADLAEYLGVEPATELPQRDAHSRWPAFKPTPTRRVG